MPDFEVIDDERLELTIPRTVPPGEYRIGLSTPQGPVRSDVSVSVTPLDLAGELDREGAGYRLQVSCSGPAGWPLTIWFASSLRSEPAQTSYGTFHLAADPDGRPPGFPETPFYFERLGLLQNQGRFDAAGSFRLQQDIDGAALDGFPAGVFVQAVIGNPDLEYHAVLSGPLSLPVPRAPRP